MNVKSHFRHLALGVGILGLLVMPMAVKADDDNGKIRTDDQAHFDFNAGARKHHPMIWKAAQHLRQAKVTLWFAASDFNGHKLAALGAINVVLDQLRICETK